MDISRRFALSAGIGALAAAQAAWSREPGPANSNGAIDAVIADFMRAFEIPGVSVAVIRPGQPAYTRGYGVRKLGGPERVDADTLFAIASNTKAFTAACLALLVEEGRLGWDEPVIKSMPDFAMSDPTATQLMTVRDLLVHRSGLALGAGDLMQFPGSDRTRKEILHGLRYLPMARGFRSGYAYDNILYVVAGMLIERISGQTYEDFLTARLLRPLGMNDAAAVRSRLHTANVAGRHGRFGPPVRGMGPMRLVEAEEGHAASPAGGLHASANDIVFWLRAQLQRGALSDGRRLWTEATANEMWTPQVITASTAGPTAELPTRAVMAGYALGWGVTDYRGRRMIRHAGALTGQLTHTAIFPDHGLALAVFTNSEGAGVPALRNTIADQLLGEHGFDWLASAKAEQARDHAEALSEAGGDFDRPPPGGPSLPLAAYAGRYRDPWYGDIVITEKKGGLYIDFTRSPGFQSALEPWGPDGFRTRFAPDAGENAVVTAVVENGRVPRLKLRAHSPLADFSYDFHDLNPVRVS